MSINSNGHAEVIRDLVNEYLRRIIVRTDLQRYLGPFRFSISQKKQGLSD